MSFTGGKAVKEGSGKFQKASAYAKLWNCNAKREMMMRLRKVHGKVFHRKAVKESSGKVQKARAYAGGCVVVDLGVDDLEMSRIAHVYSATALPYKEVKCHGKVVHRRR